MPKGMLVIVSAPSGTGKSTLCRRLLQKRKELRVSVSCTTRQPRPGEKNGKHYFFLTREDFKRKIQRSEFLEWAVVHDEYYGTPRHFIEAQVKEGHDILLAIDVQGAASIRRKMPDAVLIFLVPPSMESLRERLAGRRDQDGTMAKRLANSRSEMSAAKHYDYLVVNDDLEKAVEQVESILTAERLKVSRREMRDLAAV